MRFALESFFVGVGMHRTSRTNGPTNAQGSPLRDFLLRSRRITVKARGEKLGAQFGAQLDKKSLHSVVIHSDRSGRKSEENRPS
jgi:hypothetical protein